MQLVQVVDGPMRILQIILAAILAAGLGAFPAAAEPRVALVIGNSAYGAEMGALPNPANDAALIAQALRKVGFDVIEVTDASQKKMKRAIVDFGQKLTDAGPGTTGLFFYAGHGVQVGGENYLIPVKAQIRREGDVEVEAVPANMVLKQMDFSGSRVSIVILDACRNNPLARSLRSATRGLAEISDRPTGSFIAYSTAPGQTAADGTGRNSPYSSALAEAIQTPGLGIEEVFRTVRGKVIAATDQQQVPWDASSLTAPFYFLPPAAAPATPAPAAQVSMLDTRQVEIAFWNSIKDSQAPEDFIAYLEQYPKGAFVKLARNRIAALGSGKDREPATTAAIVSGMAAAKPPAPPAAAAPDADTALGICEADDTPDPERLAACRSAVDSGKLSGEKQHTAQNELGRAYYTLGQAAEAEAQFQAAIATDPKDAAPYFNTGLILADRQDYAGARRLFDQAARLDPQDPDAVYQRGMAAAALGDLDDARRDLDRAVAMDGKNVNYRDQRAYLRMAAGDLAGAQADVAEAGRADSDYWSLTAVLVNYLAGKPGAAAAMADRVIQGEPEYPYGMLWKALALKAQGKTAAAEALLATGAAKFSKAAWPTPLFAFLQGGLSDAKLLAAAQSDDPKTRRERLCEYYFYTGEAAYLAGKRDLAATRLKQATETGIYYYLEDGAARMRLRQVAP